MSRSPPHVFYTRQRSHTGIQFERQQSALAAACHQAKAGGSACGRAGRRSSACPRWRGKHRRAEGGGGVRACEGQQAVAEQHAVLLGRQVPALNHLHGAARRRRIRAGGPFAACMPHTFVSMRTAGRDSGSLCLDLFACPSPQTGPANRHSHPVTGNQALNCMEGLGC